MTDLFVVIAAVFGLLAGSFVSAWSWRLNSDLSIARGRSICPQCRHRLSAVDLIPVFSWLSARGRCRYCEHSISGRYPIIETVTASLFVASFLSWNPAANMAIPGLITWLLIIVFMMVIAVYDYEHMLVPLLPVYIIGGLALARLLLMAYTGVSLQVWLVSPLLAALFAGGFFYLLYRLSSETWMGGGDVYLAIIMGLLLGLAKTALALFLAFNIAALISLSLIALKLKTRKDLVPFGPFMLGATVLAFLYGEQIIQWYQSLLLV